eukprot:Skav215739  [mRNA]  locus=scaffold2859:150536:154398:+ [translate_table: standard]
MEFGDLHLQLPDGFEDGVKQIEVAETNVLGRGAGGVVCRATHKPTGHAMCRIPLAVKIVRVEDKADKAKRDQLINEVHTLFRISKSHFLIELYDAWAAHGHPVQYVHKERGFCWAMSAQCPCAAADLGSLADVKRNVEMVPENLLVCASVVNSCRA